MKEVRFTPRLLPAMQYPTAPTISTAIGAARGKGRRLANDDFRREAEKRRVFISHSARDRWVARQIARAVEERGAEAFLDEARIEVGADS